MVVFWKKDSGRQSPLISPENEGGDETSCPSPPKFTFFDDPDVPFRPRPHGPFDQPRGPYPELEDPPDPTDIPGFPPGLPPAPPPAGRQRTRAVDQSRERSRPRSPSPQPQLFHIPMSDGDDDQPPQTGRQRQRSRSSERSYPRAQVPKGLQVQPMIIQEPVTDPDEDPAVVIPYHQPDLHLQLSNEIAPEDNKDPVRVSVHLNEHLHIHLHSLASCPDMLYLLPENLKFKPRKSTLLQGKENPQNQKGKKTKKEVGKPNDLPIAKKHKSMDSDEDDEEPQHEPGTSSTSPVLPLNQGQAASLQGPATSPNAGDED